MILPYNDVEIAERMNKSRSSYSRSVNEGPITNGFLNKFYAAFGEELKTLREEKDGIEPETYLAKVEDLQGSYERLNHIREELIESQKNIAAGILRLEEKIEKILSWMSDKEKK